MVALINVVKVVHAGKNKMALVVVSIKSTRCLDPVRRPVTRLALVWVALGMCLAAPQARASDVAAFLADYRGAVKQQMARRTSFEVEGVFVEVRTQKPPAVSPDRSVREFIYTHNATHEKLQSHFTEKTRAVQSLGEVTVYVQGPERNFWLNKPASGGDFAITLMQSPTATSQDPINRQRGFLINAWSNLGTYSIATLLDSPGFKVERVEPEGDLIGVDFSFRPDDPKKQNQLMAGHFVVDPAQGMAIRRQEVRRWVSAKPDLVQVVRSEATYRMADGIALPDEVDLQFFRSNQPPSDHLHFKASRVSTAPVPDSTFTLAAFGLGDLEKPAPRSRFDFTYWAVGLAGVAFALSLFLKWRSRNLARAGDRSVGVAG